LAVSALLLLLLHSPAALARRSRPDSRFVLIGSSSSGKEAIVNDLVDRIDTLELAGGLREGAAGAATQEKDVAFSVDGQQLHAKTRSVLVSDVWLEFIDTPHTNSANNTEIIKSILHYLSTFDEIGAVILRFDDSQLQNEQTFSRALTPFSKIASAGNLVIVLDTVEQSFNHETVIEDVFQAKIPVFLSGGDDAIPPLYSFSHSTPGATYLRILNANYA
jgi:hypothetical protein